MKKYLSLFIAGLLLGSSAPSMAQEKAVDALVLQLRSGEQHAFLLSDRPHVDFHDGSLTVQSPEFEAAYADVSKFYFANADEVAISAPAARRFLLTYVDGNTVLVQGVEAGAAVSLYGVDGKSYQPAIDRADTQLTIHLNQLQRGVYVIRINQQSYKITKR